MKDMSNREKARMMQPSSQCQAKAAGSTDVALLQLPCFGAALLISGRMLS